MPDHPEALGLAALLGFAAARRGARIQTDVFVPLNEQDPSDWDVPLTRGAQALLHKAGAFGRMGRFQLEAAIQAIHARRIDGEHVDWPALAQLYAGLCKFYPTLGAQIGSAAVLSEVQGPGAGLALLDRLDRTQIAGIQSYHATRAHLLAQNSMLNEAAKSYETALALTPQPALRKFLEAKRSAIVRLL